MVSFEIFILIPVRYTVCLPAYRTGRRPQNVSGPSCLNSPWANHINSIIKPETYFVSLRLVQGGPYLIRRPQCMTYIACFSLTVFTCYWEWTPLIIVIVVECGEKDLFSKATNLAAYACSETRDLGTIAQARACIRGLKYCVLARLKKGHRQHQLLSSHQRFTISLD